MKMVINGAVQEGIRAAAFVFILSAVITNVISAHSWVDWYRMTTYGVATQAIVTMWQRTKAGYFCNLRYSVDGRTYDASNARCPGTTTVGESISITYLPSQPSFATGTSPREELASETLMPAAFSVFVGFWAAWRRRKRDAEAANS